MMGARGKCSRLDGARFGRVVRVYMRGIASVTMRAYARAGFVRMMASLFRFAIAATVAAAIRAPKYLFVRRGMDRARFLFRFVGCHMFGLSVQAWTCGTYAGSYAARFFPPVVGFRR